MKWSLSTRSRNDFQYIEAPYVNMREIPGGEVVSQALFGERVSIVSAREGFLYMTTPDGYSGWVSKEETLSLDHPYGVSHQVARLSAPVYSSKSIRMGPLFFLPYGVGVRVVEEEIDWVKIELPSGKICYTQAAHVQAPQTLRKEEIGPWSLQFLGLPYLWGGRSSFGFDCSGFVQMLYLQMGVQLPRDAYMQAEVLQDLAREEMEAGDLIFWGKSLENIQHVGCFLGGDQFIHATSKEQKPYLRISSLSESAWMEGNDSLFPYRCFKTR